MQAPLSTRTRTLAAGAAALALAAWAAPLGAQAECREGAISQIFVDNNSVFDVGDPELDPRFNWAYRLANAAHVRTREGVIRRELLFREGDCYSPARLEDSERILRAASFIADADVFAIRQADGSWHVVVETEDEWSTRLEPQLESGNGLELTGLELREDNLFGRGQRLSAFVKEYQGERIYGAAFATRQLFRTHLDGELALARTPVGYAVSQRLAYPFRGEGGRWAFREQAGHEEANFEFFVPRDDGGLERRLFPVQARSFDVGTVYRLGRRGNLTMLGLALAGEWVVYPQEYLTPRPLDRSEGAAEQAQPEPPEPVVGLDTISSVRAVFLLGQRNVWFDRRRALDAVRGTEDVRLGVEAELGVGRSISAFSDDDDLALNAGFFAAGDLPGGVLGGVHVVGEAKRDFGASGGAPQWRNIFGQVDAWAYWRPNPESRHTFVAAASGAGGWRTMVPFQLTLGYRAGLRGLDRHAFAGERRVVGTLEHRMYLGWPYPQLFDLGTAAFVDVGRIWAGGDTFNDDAPTQASAGLGLRLAFPPGSRRTYRLDFGFPLTGGGGFGDLTVSVGMGQAVGRGAVREDPQLLRSSRRPLSASLFSFPN